MIFEYISSLTLQSYFTIFINPSTLKPFNNFASEFANFEQSNNLDWDMSRLIVMAGLPGTGKTTLARRLSQELQFFYLRVDCIEAPFAAVHPAAGENGESYEALIHLARENLSLGHNLIIDTVNPLHRSRAMFYQLKDTTLSEIIQFELKIADSAIHKQRVENRLPDIKDLMVPSWHNVLKRHYEAWDEKTDGKRYEVWTDDIEEAFRRCLTVIDAQWNDSNEA